MLLMQMQTDPRVGEFVQCMMGASGMNMQMFGGKDGPTGGPMAGGAGAGGMGGQDPETAKMMEEARKEMEAEREAEAKKKAAEEEAAKKAKEAEGKGPGWSEALSLFFG